MNAADYADYIDCFNRSDFEGFGKYYHDDVLFELGDKRTIVGRENILDFYRDVKSKVRETLDIVSAVGDENHLAVHVRTEFYGLEDWPDFVAGRLMKGESINIESLGYYYLRDGKIARILGARFKTAK
jgi:hypothetical protein